LEEVNTGGGPKVRASNPAAGSEAHPPC